MDKGFGNPPGEVGSRSVDLGVILSGESTSTVGTPAAVGVDDDLTTGKTGVTLRAADDEESRGLKLRRINIKSRKPLMKIEVVKPFVVRVSELMVHLHDRRCVRRGIARG